MNYEYENVSQVKLLVSMLTKTSNLDDFSFLLKRLCFFIHEKKNNTSR